MATSILLMRTLNQLSKVNSDKIIHLVNVRIKPNQPEFNFYAVRYNIYKRGNLCRLEIPNFMTTHFRKGHC